MYKDLETRETAVVSSLDFSFCLIYPRLVAEEASSSETATGADKKEIHYYYRFLLSLIRGPGRGQHSKSEHL